MSALFVEALMDHIMEGAMIPKVQIERAVGPIMSMFLADVLTETFRDDPVLSGTLVMISPEFPLKKAGNQQSTNIDWLMFNPERRQLLFIELKTSDTSLDTEQNAIYHARQQAIRSEGGSSLIEDLLKMMKASSETGKYQYILDEKLATHRAGIGACQDARIIYLAPGSVAHKIQDQADRVLTFAMLSDSITGPFAEEWSIIRNHLCALDGSSRRMRNHKSAPAAEMHVSPNYADRFDYPSIVMLCRKLGNEVLVGFTGGVDALASMDVVSLEKRLYKWDNTAGNIGTKLFGNWIPGSVFLETINEKSAKPVRPKPAPKRPSRWSGTLNFSGMFDLCREHGNEIMVGFTGGGDAFARKSLSELQKRPTYKWDFANNKTGKKLSDWLPGATIIELLKSQHNYP